MDQTAGGATEAEDGADQEGDDAAERQARRPESQRCEDDLFFLQKSQNMKYGRVEYVGIDTF